MILLMQSFLSAFYRKNLLISESLHRKVLDSIQILHTAEQEDRHCLSGYAVIGLPFRFPQFSEARFSGGENDVHEW